MPSKPLDQFTKRELRLVRNCMKYATDDPAGLPGHNLEIIIEKLMKELNIPLGLLETLIAARKEDNA